MDVGPHGVWTKSLPDFMVVELFNGGSGLLFGAEGDEGVASVVSVEVHHHPDLVDLSKLKTERQKSQHPDATEVSSAEIQDRNSSTAS